MGLHSPREDVATCIYKCLKGAFASRVAADLMCTRTFGVRVAPFLLSWT